MQSCFSGSCPSVSPTRAPFDQVSIATSAGPQTVIRLAVPGLPRDQTFLKVLSLMIASVFVLALSACGTLMGVTTSNSKRIAINGRVLGGRQPVVGASVQFYAAGKSAEGTGASAMLATPLLTDSAGHFSVPPEGFNCQSPSDLIYVVSTGGNPGLPAGATNPVSELMTAIGPCSSVSTLQNIDINELTTVASVWSLAPYMSSNGIVGSSITDQAALANSFSMVSDFIDIQTGTVPGPALPAGWSVQTAKLNTLGNILAACVNSKGGAAGDGSLCGELFANTRDATGADVTNVLDASVQIATNPTRNVSQIFALSPATPPWEPSLDTSPSDWTLSFTSPVSAPTISPSGGSFSGSQLVTISDYAGAAIYYTTDGTLPTQSSLPYSGAITLTSSATVRAIAVASGANSTISSATFTANSPVAAKLAFSVQPATGGVGTVLSPAVTVLVEDSLGNLISNSTNPITVGLNPEASAAKFGGTLTVSAVQGNATFNDLTVGTIGEDYQLVASSPGLNPATSSAFSITPTSNGSTFSVPAANTCQSRYDNFYQYEPGVFAFWPLCEASGNIGYDNFGLWSLASGFGTNSSILGGRSGPVTDNETASQVSDSQFKLENQGIVLNKNAGTLALWINSDAPTYPVPAESLSAVIGSSSVSIKIANSTSVCFIAELVNKNVAAVDAQQCGYSADTWHRVVMTWDANTIDLYVDGIQKRTATYSGTLDDTIFYYQLFPGCCITGKQMTLAKALVSNQTWTPTQVSADFSPTFVTTPRGGIYVTTQQLGTIHKDVLGYADNNQDISTPPLLTSLASGLDNAGVTSVRYAGGFAGIAADGADWQHGSVSCAQNGGALPAQNISTNNNIDTYIPQVTIDLGLSLGYTVNYGSNPPACNAGGDPTVNGANLVQYANITKHYGIKYWEIGNEQYAYGGPLIDLHPNPYLNGGNAPTTYPTYEPAFYDEMKAVDPSIKVGVPATGPSNYNWEINYEYPVLLGAKYDAAIYHSYPLLDPITDGATLYPDRISSGTQVRGSLLALQTQLLDVGKPADAIWITEWNGEVSGNKWSRQTLGAAAPMFAAIQLAEYMRAGVQYATWLAQGMTDVCSTYNVDYAGSTSYNWYDGCGNTALVYTGPVSGVGEILIGMKNADLTPTARAFEMLSNSGFVTEGEHMLETVTDVQNAPWLMGYSATHGSQYAIMLINRDRDAAHVVPVTIAGLVSGSAVTQWTYGRAQYDQSYFGNWSVGPVQAVHGSWNGSFQASLPPWSINILILGN